MMLHLRAGKVYQRYSGGASDDLADLGGPARFNADPGHLHIGQNRPARLAESWHCG
jgi:hypothetical protein